MCTVNQYKIVCFCLFPLQMLLVDYYRAAPDIVQFSQYWCPDTTMMDKIKVRGFLPGCPLTWILRLFRGHHTWSNLSWLFLSSSSGLPELPRPQRPGLLSDLRARLQSADQPAVSGDLLCMCACGHSASQSPSTSKTFLRRANERTM